MVLTAVKKGAVVAHKRAIQKKNKRRCSTSDNKNVPTAKRHSPPDPDRMYSIDAVPLHVNDRAGECLLHATHVIQRRIGRRLHNALSRMSASNNEDVQVNTTATAHTIDLTSPESTKKLAAPPPSPPPIPAHAIPLPVAVKVSGGDLPVSKGSFREYSMTQLKDLKNAIVSVTELCQFLQATRDKGSAGTNTQHRVSKERLQLRKELTVLLGGLQPHMLNYLGF